MVASNFDRCLQGVLANEGGNDDDPQDPGGRTSRGITQSEYDVWRQARGMATLDVWNAGTAEIRAIYYGEYWQKVRGDDLPSGIDYAIFDYGVNSGNARAAKVLQGIVGVATDGSIGPQTLTAVGLHNPSMIITELCDERLAFLKDLRTWPRFGGGWDRRVAEVRAMALGMAGEQPGAST